MGIQTSVTDASLPTSDVTTNDVSTTKHGFAPKAPNNTTTFLRGDATYAAPTAADATPEMEFYSTFAASGEFNGSVGGSGANTFNSTGLTVDTGGTGTSFTKIIKYATNVQYAVFASNSYFSTDSICRI